MDERLGGSSDEECSECQVRRGMDGHCRHQFGHCWLLQYGKESAQEKGRW